MKTVDIKGKEYVMVNERIKFFRENYPDYSLVSDIISMEDGTVTMKASVITPDNRVIATGHAQEKETNGFINKFSYIENCETSAWGRCLANMGIGVDASVASADEVANAIKNQSMKEPPKITLTKTLIDKFDKCENINQVKKVWSSLSEDEKAISKGYKEGLEKKLVKEKFDYYVDKIDATNFDKNRFFLEAIINEERDQDKKQSLIIKYNSRLDELNIEDKYELLPFGEK